MIALRQPLLLLLLPALLWLAWRMPYRWGIPSSRPSSPLQRLTARWFPMALALLIGLAATGPEWRQEVKGMAPVVDFGKLDHVLLVTGGAARDVASHFLNDG